MRREDVEAMLQELAGTTRYLHDTGKSLLQAAHHMSEAADRMVAMSDHLKDIADRTANAITTGRNALDGDEE